MFYSQGSNTPILFTDNALPDADINYLTEVILLPHWISEPVLRVLIEITVPALDWSVGVKGFDKQAGSVNESEISVRLARYWKCENFYRYLLA